MWYSKCVGISCRFDILTFGILLVWSAGYLIYIIWIFIHIVIITRIINGSFAVKIFQIIRVIRIYINIPEVTRLIIMLMVLLLLLINMFLSWYLLTEIIIIVVISRIIKIWNKFLITTSFSSLLWIYILKRNHALTKIVMNAMEMRKDNVLFVPTNSEKLF